MARPDRRVQLQAVIKRIQPLDEQAMLAARQRQDLLTIPPGSLGRLERLATQLAGINGVPLPRLPRKAVIVMAADHGVTREGVSAYPPEVTAQMAQNFARGGAAINVLARQAKARVIAVDVGAATELASSLPIIHRKVAFGTANFPGTSEGTDQATAPAVASSSCRRLRLTLQLCAVEFILLRWPHIFEREVGQPVIHDLDGPGREKWHTQRGDCKRPRR